jgi:hypothetical protein
MGDLDLVKPCWQGYNLNFRQKRNMAVNNKFKYFGKIIKETYGYTSIFDNRDTAAIFKTRIMASCFHKIENRRSNKVRFKIRLRSGTKISEQILINEPAMSSNSTYLDGLRRVRALKASE